MEANLAVKLDRLFRTHLKPDGSQYSYEDVAKGSGGAVTGPYVWKLRNGQAQNPGYRVLAALSRFFDIPVTYFFAEEPVSEQEYEEDMALARSLRKAGVKQIALRVSDLDEDARADILSMIEYVRSARGLPSLEGTGQPEDHEAKDHEAKGDEAGG